MSDLADGPFDGEILAHSSDPSHLKIRLASGDEITAVLSKNRKFGCLLGSLVGYKVKVVFRKSPKMACVIDLVRRL